MGFVEDMTKGSFSTVLVGVGVALVASSVLPALASGLRPLVKVLIKGGVDVYDAAKETLTEVGEQVSDLVAEVRAEKTAAEKAAMTIAGPEVHEKKKDG